MKKIAIVGCGACGLVSAIVAAKEGAKVTIFEKSYKCGRKILASGNGRCNITNEDISLEFYHGRYPHFAKEALRFDAKRFFNKMGLELKRKKGTRLYPLSDQASIVLDFLLYEVRKSGIEIVENCEINKIIPKNGSFVLNDEYHIDSVILACGSNAMPHLGGGDSGYDLALSLGHQIERPFASLVQLISSDDLFTKASGVKVEAAIELFIDNSLKLSKVGDLLFTNYGLSGSAILDLSRSASFALSRKRRVHVVIDFLPQIEKEALKHLLFDRAKIDLPIDLWLGGLINKKLINPILKKADLRRTKPVNKKEINRLLHTLKSLKIDIEDTKGYKKAEVMAGGVSTKDIDPKTMESKLHKGLFFCGELLDIDGDCGGYNLNWAWSSGYLAGKNAV